MYKIPFTVSAKTARLIGQENFSNAEGAVIELVKNAYDADATVSVVCIDTTHDNLYIIDNGDGMTAEIVRESWMVIGTDDKVDTIKSNNNRVKTGAKGIGRFAMDRLGYRTQMSSKMKNTEGVSWSIDWKQFEQKNKTISDIKAELDNINDLSLKDEIKVILKDFDLENSFFDNWNDNKGTIIKISGLKDSWIGYKHEKEILENVITENLFRTLENLVPPLENDFLKIYLFHSEFKKKYGEIPASVVEDYDYKIRIKATQDNELIVTIWQDEINLNAINQQGFFEKTKLAKSNPNYSLTTFEKGYFQVIKTFGDIVGNNTNLLPVYDEIGAFEADIYFMKRGAGGEDDQELDSEKIYNYRRVDYKDRKKWLDKFGGVKLYRDNVRVRPYGDPKDGAFDWLGLRPRSARSNSITKGRWKLSDRQVYGIVKITRLGNVGLEDKSNREGLKENETFQAFRHLLLASIDIFEGERTILFRALQELYSINNPKVEIEKKAEKIRKERQKQQKKRNLHTNTEGSTDDVSNNNLNNSEDKKEKEDTDILLDALDLANKQKEEAIQSQRIMQALASTGLSVTAFAHDFENISGNLVSRTKWLEDSLKPFINKTSAKKLQDYANPYVQIEQIRQEDEKLGKWLDFAISTVKSSKRRKKDIDFEIYFESVAKTWQPQFAERFINFVCLPVKNVNFNAFEIDLDSIFVNLFANSIESFSKKNASNKRLIKIAYGKSSDDIFIIYEDSGPGLDKSISDPYRIFDIFFSTKTDPRTNEIIGTGLGMYIFKNVVENYNGSIEILEYQTQFKIRISFPLKSI